MHLTVGVGTGVVVFNDLETRIEILQTLKEIIRIYLAELVSVNCYVSASEGVFVSVADTIDDHFAKVKGVGLERDFQVVLGARYLVRNGLVANVGYAD